MTRRMQWRPAQFFLFLLAGFPVSAATLSAGSVDVHPKDADVNVTLTIASASGESVSGVQFDIELAEDVAIVTAMDAGAAAVAAVKSVSFSKVGTGRYRAIVAGLNQNVIQDGELVLMRLDVGAAPPDGAQPLEITGLVMSDPNGKAVSATAESGTVNVIGGVPSDDDGCGCAKGSISTGTPGRFSGDVICLLVLLLLLRPATRYA